MLERRINELKGKIIHFSALIEQMQDKSIRGLVNRDEKLLREVMETDEPMANEFELVIDGLCTTLIAQFQPMARDLRSILMTYNMNTALERMADHSVNIAKCALDLIAQPPIKPFIDIPRMNELARKMLADSINAFIKGDAELAQKVCESDCLVDGLRDQIMRELITFMAGNPAIISSCIQILRIAENLERIADLSTNIAEDAIFIASGEVIKHHRREAKKAT
jgi:phosphate transport system protein